MFGTLSSRRFPSPDGGDLPGPGSYASGASLEVSNNLMGVGLASTSQRFLVPSKQDKGMIKISWMGDRTECLLWARGCFC